MLGVAFLVISFLIGYKLMWWGREDVKAALRIKGFSGKRVKLSELMVLVPGGFLVGTLVVGWLVYLVSLFLSAFVDEPLRWGNVIVIGGLGLLLAGRLLTGKKRMRILKRIRDDRNEWLVPVAVGLVFAFLFYYTFRVIGEKILVGASVYSDFGPHLTLIRSFSRGSNFPTLYPHFPAADIKYHFMFDFVAGNLEFLGMRLDHAFNVLSILAAMSFGLLLYVLAVVMSGKKMVGAVTLVLWFFRSSPAFWNFVVEHKTFQELLSGFLGLNRFVGQTNHEDWGLWNQNVYLNQRHLLFGWGLLLLVLLLLLPIWMKKESFWERVKTRVIGRPQVNLKRMLFLGLILGGLGFWNGAVVISALLILGGLMMFSKNRGEYVGIALISLSLVWLSKQLFIKGGLMEPQWLFGFLAEERNLRSVLGYWLELMGIWLLMLPASLIFIPRKFWGIMVAMAVPFIFANLVSLTPDIAVNHKYVMISVVLLNIFVAYFLGRVYERRIWGKVIFIGLLFMLISTGVLDLTAVLNVNKRPLSYTLGGSYSRFLEGTKPRSIFLTDEMPVIGSELLSGRYVYFGWPYYAWSAGYDTDARQATMIELYQELNGVRLREKLIAEGIDYVVYRPTEPKNIAVTGREFEKVYEDKDRVVFEVN